MNNIKSMNSKLRTIEIKRHRIRMQIEKLREEDGKLSVQYAALKTDLYLLGRKY